MFAWAPGAESSRSNCSVLFCSAGHAPESECDGEFKWGCVVCFRAQRRSAEKVRELLCLRCEEQWVEEIELDVSSKAEQHRDMLGCLLMIQANG